MTKTEQRRIVNDLCKGLRSTMLEKVKDIPDEWTGIEIRQWMADVARERYVGQPMERERRRHYNNEVLVRNLT